MRGSERQSGSGSDTAKVRVIEDGSSVALVEISRPEARNALDVETVGALAAAIDALDGDPAIRAIVLTGANGHFSAGSDIKEMSSRGLACLRDPVRVAGWRRLEQVRTPFIAAVDGMALGAGLELALLADFIVCSQSARFGLPEVTLGLAPGDGGSQRLARLIGQGAALRLMLTGEIMSADDAVRLGIAGAGDDPVAMARETGLRLARKIARNAPLATSMVKQVVRNGLDCALSGGLALEAGALDVLFSTGDCAEGLAAFVEKRPPIFRGI